MKNAKRTGEIFQRKSRIRLYFARQGGSGVFVHVHDVEVASMKTLVRDQLVTYNTAPARNGLAPRRA
jgi:hypothetical protein